MCHVPLIYLLIQQTIIRINVKILFYITHNMEFNLFDIFTETLFFSKII